MKISSRIKRNLRLKYTAIMILLAMALTALGLPCVAQTPDSAAVENPAVYDNLLRPSAPVDTTAGTPEIILDGIREEAVAEPSGGEYHPPAATADTIAIISGYPQSIYGRPASWTYSDPWWHGMWINTAVYAGAFVGTLFVLECLPEDATAWNRKEITSRPFYERWYRNVFKLGPEWDHDKFIFNYVLHPYAGAAYFMAAIFRGNLHHRMGIRHRGLHGTPLLSGHLRHSDCRLPYGRRVLPPQAPDCEPRLPCARLSGHRAYMRVLPRPGKRGRRTALTPLALPHNRAGMPPLAAAPHPHTGPRRLAGVRPHSKCYILNTIICTSKTYKTVTYPQSSGPLFGR